MSTDDPFPDGKFGPIALEAIKVCGETLTWTKSDLREEIVRLRLLLKEKEKES